ncbi:MAG: multiheme c-type cytochrome, partial [Planctomycetota bacterium]
ADSAATAAPPGDVATGTDTTAAPALKPLRKGKHSGIPFDPIKENGPIFVDWPKPKVAIIITGRELGYLEPCGCAGLDRMKGGLSRRHSLFNTLREQGWPVVGVDVGGLIKGFGRQAELKFHTTVEGMRKMGFDAINFGTQELQLPAGELVAVAATEQSPFLSANVGLFGFDANVTPKYRVIEAGGMRIGVTGVLGKQNQKVLHNADLEMADPAEAIRKVLPELKQKADYLILLAHAGKDEAAELARQFPEFQIVVDASDIAEPPGKPEMVGEKTLLIQVGEKGMNAVVVGLYDDPQTPWRYQRVPLDSRFASSPDMLLLMQAYQTQIKELGLQGLNVRTVPHPLAETNGGFVGSEKCFSCHEVSYEIWKKSGHGRAYDTLVKADPPRNFDPECISCHVVGWHPTKYFPYETGYLSLEETPHLIDTGCETCHGPGENHVNAELGADKVYQEKMRKAVVITKEESKEKQCQTCHDLDNSPDFEFDTYWPYVEHYED